MEKEFERYGLPQHRKLTGVLQLLGSAGIFLGMLADKIGRKNTIILGLVLFVVNSYLFIVGNSFYFFLILVVISGFAIGIFKTGALALIGDISKSTNEHTSTMNMVEGFFGVGSIIGPFLVSYFLTRGTDWKWLYVVAATLCVFLILVAIFVKYPQTIKQETESVNIGRTLRMVKNPYALGFSLAAFLYVAVEAAIYVWMPTLIAGYDGKLVFVATYALPIFFILRAGGRFIGAWMMSKFNWETVLVISGFFILICYLGSLLGIGYAVVFLPLSGLFMSTLYPTINSKGISCFPKSEHGAVAGIILFFTAGGAALGPLAMGAFSDLMGSDAKYGFMLATVFAGILFAGALYNLIVIDHNSRPKHSISQEFKSNRPDAVMD